MKHLWLVLKSLLVSGLFACGSLAIGATPDLVADVNQQPENIGASPSDMVAAGGRVFFTGESRVFGRELWVTDGTETGTRLVKDLCVGQTGSLPSQLRAVGKRVFFFADDGEHGRKLWSSDGETTIMAGGPSLGTYGLTLRQATGAGHLLYFNADLGNFSSYLGRTLWRSDGTVEGTWLLNPAQGGGFPPQRPFDDSQLLTKVDGGGLFFSNRDHELWSSSGTRNQTVKAADLGYGSQIISIAGENGRVWFTADRGEDKELWSWFGGKAAIISSIPAGASATDGLVARRGRAFFVAIDAKTGSELWTSDGKVTRRVRDIRAGLPSSSPGDLTWCGGTLYFTAEDGITGRGLWASNGKKAWPVKTWKGGVGPTKLTSNGNTLFFLRDEGGQVLWRSDGTAAGTWPVKQVTTARTSYASPGLISDSGHLYFQGNDGKSGYELWSSDGTRKGTGMLRDLKGTRDGLIGVEPGGMAAWGDRLAFCGNDGISGEEPWRSDGTKTGTRILADVVPGPKGSEPNRFAAAGGNLFFNANDGVHGSELWRSGKGSTTLVRDINPGSGSAYLSELTPFGERMAFTAQDKAGSGLWISDGDNAVKVKDKVWGQMAALGGGLIFAARNAGYNEEPWWTDGVTTRLIKELIPGSDGSDPAWFTKVGKEVYFQAYGDAGFRLWRTDGTESGTLKVSGWQGPGAIYPMVSAGSRLFFFEEKGANGLRLWMAENGQAAFVRQIGDKGPEYPFPVPAIPYVEACGGQLFFVADDGIHGAELWRSDGTPAGTVMVRDIRPGSIGSAPVNLRTVGATVFFQANDGVSGEELWCTGGTAAGTRLVADIVPGSGGSAPGHMVLVGNRLYFSAVTEKTGCEPYVLEVSSLLEINPSPGTSGLAGLDASSMAAPDGSGAEKLLNFAFGIDGTAPDQVITAGGPGHLPSISVITEGRGKILKVAYARRTGSSLIYTAMRSPSLEEGSFLPMAGDEVVVPDGDGWERVVRSERVEGERWFGLVKVTQP